ncbi:MAG TPA: hypothetical protein VFQ40_02610 [Actinomycetota bacterium]|nr:hypothetical protein [Actinomycetota bacterium]
MKVSTSRRLLLALAGVFLGGILLLALAGDAEARRELPAQLAAWGTIGAIVFAGYWFKVRPRRDLHRAEAAELRLASTPGDPFGMLDRGFALLGQVATAKDVENTSWGTWRGLDVMVFDYWFARSSDPQLADHEFFTCAATSAPAAWPDLAVIPRSPYGRLAHALGLRAVELELERFNRAFEVRSADPRFATAFLDARMMDWLLALPVGTGFELRGATLLAVVPRPTFADVPFALETMLAFLHRVPAVIGSLYGERP